MRYFWPLSLALITAALAYFSPISYADSDPLFSLLTAQAILEHGSAELSPYREAVEAVPDRYRLYDMDDGRLYYAFPLGSALFGLPAVAVARGLGLDMANRAEEAVVQKWLSILTSVLAVLLLYALAQSHLPPLASAGLAAVFMWGTVLITTLATAFWSLNVVVVLETAALLLLVGMAQGRAVRGAGAWLGLCLLGMFVSRASTAVPIAVVVVTVGWAYRRHFWPMALVAGGGLVLFGVFSWGTYGLPIPPYYLPISLGGLQGFSEGSRHELASPWWAVVYGLLFSPSRGAFIFSPMLLAVVAAVAGQKRPWWARPLVGTALAWIALHLFTVMRFHMWWGGFGFGPRLLVEIMPPLFWLAVMVWPTSPHAPNRWLPVAFGVLAVPALLIHSGAGLFNKYAVYWNSDPRPLVTPRMVLDWRTPQFLASAESLCARSLRYHREAVLTFEEVWLVEQPSVLITPATADINLWLKNGAWAERPSHEGMAPPLGYPHTAYLPLVAKWGPIGGLWAGFQPWGEMLCAEAHILFRGSVKNRPREVVVTAVAVGEAQVVAVSLNGRLLGHILPRTALSDSWVIPLPAAYLDENLNQLTFGAAELAFPYDLTHPQRRTILVQSVQVR